LPGQMDERKRAKLAAELDRDGQWFRRAVRRYRTRGWVRDMRRALGIQMAFLMDETQVSRKTLNLAERREATGAIQISELKALAEAMECKLVYAIVPERGTVAELAERRRENPRKTRTEREKETKEYMEWYNRQVEEMKKQDPVNASMAEWRKELEGAGTERPGTEEPGAEGREVEVKPLHSPGVQKLVNEIAKKRGGTVVGEPSPRVKLN